MSKNSDFKRKMMHLSDFVKTEGKVTMVSLCWDFGVNSATLRKYAEEYDLKVRKEFYMKGKTEAIRHVVVYIGK